MSQTEPCPIPTELLDRAALWYRGGQSRAVGNGYVKEYNPFHRNADSRGFVSQHRLVLERHLGRLLDRREVVHHIDNNKKNNAIENLQLFESQAEHLSHHHKYDQVKACYDPNTIEAVRQAAADPKKSLKSLDISAATVIKICKQNNIVWNHGLMLTDDAVREALQGRTTAEAADVLGCHPHTLYYSFDHLLDKRKSPGFLDSRIEDVYTSATTMGIAETARRFDTNRQTIAKALRKAKLWDDYRAVSAQRVGGPQQNRRKP